ncbi:PTS sugar transporter subunit IIB [uncultured Desulfovibrio sp.]|uniref:PTS sugar transporter subunit IIB n=1 Tax=Candidatus Desulfovibrio intestinavium TaxID=2838534 RepID=A0A9D2HNC1_9BACT|nr:PTS sugar transporter subunit IIB [uncultured Desulfovibrio sp.]HJA78954.1 PTS sugar transporter subunit IIB [Candidatus Desulfovibrio intestinavium]
MTWFRVDNRLVHGQVIEGWLPYVAAKHLVVANDVMARDDLRQQITLLAVPQSVETYFVTLDALADTLRACGDSTFVLFEDCKDARQASDTGVVMKSLNIGNLHYGPGKKQLLPHVAVSEQDSEDLRTLLARRVQLDFRCVPSEKVRDSIEQLL